jgi:serine/threonine protein kinase
VSYCVNPNCPKPQNSDEQSSCQGCGLGLLLPQGYRAISLIAQSGFVRTFLAGNKDGLLCVLRQLVTRDLIGFEFQKATTFFQQEIQLLAELGQHPQIPTLLTHFEANQCLYSVQEFIPGSNLTNLLEQDGTFSEAEIWQLLDDILPVFKFIHQHQVIHRDIKPKNIILHNFFPHQGRVRRGEFVLVDFSIAKLVTNPESLEKDASIGSPEYAAPEQIKGQAVFASDLYSLGVTCIHLLTGIAPFELYDVVNNC